MHVLSVTCLVLASVAIVSGQGSRSSGLCIDQTTCGDCIAVAPNCAWCKQEEFAGERCNLHEDLLRDKCADTEVVLRNNSITYDQNNPPQNPDSEHEAIQLTPQEVTIKLRPNKPYKLHVTFRQAENYPVDLYYLMDLSKSMEDDKTKLAELGIDLAVGMSNITENFQLGFGSFVDKKTMPYVSTVPASLLSPCDKCAAPYGFKNQLPLNEDPNQFEVKVKEAQISGNLDSPEGGFDAIMQSIVCQKAIGWREQSRKLLLFSTDAGFHYAGDGLLGGIVKPNDGDCHMNSEGYYSESLNQDYPSVSQVSHKIKSKNINIIFAVTANLMEQYEQLLPFIEGSMVGELANDSSNIVELVQQNYDKISSTVELKKRGTEDKDVFVNFRSKCGDEDWKDSTSCDDLRIGHEVSFEVTIEAKSCPEAKAEWKDFFELYPVGLAEKLKVNYELICECDCELPKADVENSPKCNGTGTYECGACTCNKGRYGKFCECDGTSLGSDDYDAACKKTNTSQVCSSNGECVCGSCDCYPIQTGGVSDPTIKYKGKYCDCDDYSCDNYQGRLCGGPERGVCMCGVCICKPGFTENDCSCATSQETCMTSNGKLCNDVGTCECGRCICAKDNWFKGPTCEDCDSCPGKCEAFKSCAQCTAFQSGAMNKDECDANCTNVITVDEIDRSDDSKRKTCRFRDDDDCFFWFTYEYETENVEVQLTKECPKPVNVLAIILGIIFAILLIGLALLLIWKLLVTIHDRREFAKFEKERQNAKWDMGENPIYKQATSTFKNPTYGQ